MSDSPTNLFLLRRNLATRCIMGPVLFTFLSSYAFAANESVDYQKASISPQKGKEMATKKADKIPGWFSGGAKGFAIGLDKSEKHSGTQSAFVESTMSKPEKFGNLMQTFVPTNYLDKRIKVSGWVKTKLESGTAQLWLRVDGDWSNTKPGCFDNMDDRPIYGDTGWKEYSMVCDVPESSHHVYFGMMLLGTGKIWLDDVSIEVVDKSVPLTGNYTTLVGCGKMEPSNLSFEDHTESKKNSSE